MADNTESKNTEQPPAQPTESNISWWGLIIFMIVLIIFVVVISAASIMSDFRKVFTLWSILDSR